MRRMAVGLSIVLVLTSGTSCSVNIMESFSKKDTDEALFHDAKNLVNEGSYDAALAKIADMDPNFQLRDEVVRMKASAYGGKCGVNFVGLVEALKNIGTDNFFVALMKGYSSGSLAKANHCITAITTMETIASTPALRTADDNVFVAIAALAELGNMFHFYADPGGDGTVDAVDLCAINASDSQKMGIAINKALYSLQASGVSIGSAALTQLTALCPGGSFCNAASPAYLVTDYDATKEAQVRTIVKDGPAAASSVGLYSCVSTTGTDPGCGMPCP